VSKSEGRPLSGSTASRPLSGSTASVGARFTLHDDAGPRKMLTLVKVANGGRKHIMNDGTEWNASWGKPWGIRDVYYHGDRVYPALPEDEARVRRRKAVAACRRMVGGLDFDRMPNEAIQAIIEACCPWQKESDK
jgi:hypothetical protein